MVFSRIKVVIVGNRKPSVKWGDWMIKSNEKGTLPSLYGGIEQCEGIERNGKACGLLCTLAR